VFGEDIAARVEDALRSIGSIIIPLVFIAGMAAID
jgi:hypothetical protein